MGGRGISSAHHGTEEADADAIDASCQLPQTEQPGLDKLFIGQSPALMGAQWAWFNPAGPQCAAQQWSGR